MVIKIEKLPKLNYANMPVFKIRQILYLKKLSGLQYIAVSVHASGRLRIFTLSSPTIILR